MVTSQNHDHNLDSARNIFCLTNAGLETSIGIILDVFGMWLTLWQEHDSDI